MDARVRGPGRSSHIDAPLLTPPRGKTPLCDGSPTDRGVVMVKRVAVLLTFLLGLVAIPGAALGAPLPARIQDQIVRVEHLRVEVLSPTLLRLEYAAND